MDRPLDYPFLPDSLFSYMATGLPNLQVSWHALFIFVIRPTIIVIQYERTGSLLIALVSPHKKPSPEGIGAAIFGCA